jgi:cell wall assembly regulator SMI1
MNQLDVLDGRIRELENFGVNSAEANMAKTRAKTSGKSTKKKGAKKASGKTTPAKKAPGKEAPAKKAPVAKMAETTRPSTIQAAWQRIESWLMQHAPARAESLKKGATPRQLEKLESQLNAELPEQFKESLLIHDGQSSDLGVVPDKGLGCHLLQVKAIVSEWEYCDDMDDSGEFDDVSIKPDKGVAREWWNRGWIPFASNDSGEFLCIDLAPTKSGKSGQVIRMQEDEPQRELLAPSFGAWLEQLADALEAGELKILY